MTALRFLIGGLCLAGIAVALWWLARPLRGRPRPNAEVAAARFRRLAPVVMALIGILVALLVVGVVVSALLSG